jgi:hypothetical protein
LLALTYQDTVSLSTDMGSDGDGDGDLELNIGGSIYLEGGSFTFDHEHNKASDVTFENSFSLYLPLTLTIGGGGIELGNLTFADTDFYDGTLSPGFDVNLQDIEGIFDEAVYLVLDLLGEQIESVRGDIVPIYDIEDGSVISPGNEIVTRTIPGTDISLNNVLGLDSLLKVGNYIRHYLRPQLPVSGGGFTRDPSIPLGNEGDNFYGPDGPTLGGFFEYLQEYWVPTLGGPAGYVAHDHQRQRHRGDRSELRSGLHL